MKKIILTLLTFITMDPLQLLAVEGRQLPPEVQKLSQLIGQWKGSARLQETGKPAEKLDARINCKPASDHWAVSCETKMTNSKMKLFETDLFGYDIQAGKLHWYAVTNAQEVHDHVGDWNGANSLVVSFKGKSEGQDMTESIRLEFKNSQLKAESTSMVGGKTAATISFDVAKK